jgi:hypothetical protein
MGGNRNNNCRGMRGTRRDLRRPKFLGDAVVRDSLTDHLISAFTAASPSAAGDQSIEDQSEVNPT